MATHSTCSLAIALVIIGSLLILWPMIYQVFIGD